MFTKRSALVLLICISAGCSPLIVPSAYQVPVVKSKGDFNVNVLTGSATQFSAQLAAMPLKNIILTASHGTNLSKNTNSHVYRHTTWGGGYIFNEEKVQFGLLGTYGYGKSRDNDLEEPIGKPAERYFTEVAYHNYQLQPYWNFIISPDFDFYTGVRASLIRTGYFATDRANRVSPGNTGTFEPFAGFKIGRNKLKLDVQLGIYSHKQTHLRGAGYLSFPTSDGLIHCNIGLGYTLNFVKHN